MVVLQICVGTQLYQGCVCQKQPTPKLWVFPTKYKTIISRNRGFTEFPIHTEKIGYQTEASQTSEKQQKKSIKLDWFPISKANKLKVLL
jgi:hypothetical protein